MKYIQLLFFLALSLFGQSQTPHEIKLSTTLNEDRMGVWTKGDYKIYIELSVLETSFRASYKSYSDAVLNYGIKDSASANYYNHTAKRFLVAAEQVEKAENGFDLKNLIIYYGTDTEVNDEFRLQMVEPYVQQFVESGTAIVFYKGTRVFVLMNLYESKGNALDFGIETRIYYDNPENYLFKKHQHLGW